MLTCRQENCGKKFRNMSLLRKHAWTEHRDSFYPVGKNGKRKKGIKNFKNSKNHLNRRELSAKDFLDILKVKRDVLNEIIIDMETKYAL